MGGAALRREQFILWDSAEPKFRKPSPQVWIRYPRILAGRAVSIRPWGVSLATLPARFLEYPLRVWVPRGKRTTLDTWAYRLSEGSLPRSRFSVSLAASPEAYRLLRAAGGIPPPEALPKRETAFRGRFRFALRFAGTIRPWPELRKYSFYWGFMVRPDRVELPTFWFVARRSIQLSYGRTR